VEREFLKIIGKRLKKEILKQHPTVEKFCFEHDIPKKTASNAINGIRNTGILTIVKISRALDIKIDDLIDRRN